MIRLLPNLLTLSRLPIALAIFFLLSLVNLSELSASRLLDVSMGLFVVALLTDVFDGLLARRLGVCTQSGRMIDALVDKILICGTFVFFMSEGFVIFAGDSQAATNVSGVEPWMVAVIFVRELVVTGLRTSTERQGREFASTIFGKAKMTMQSISILYIMFFLARGWYADPMATILRDILLWTTVAFTALSALAYVGRARSLRRVAAVADNAGGTGLRMPESGRQL